LALRLPTNHGAAADYWLARGEGSGAAHLAPRGAESSAKTEAARAAGVE
jgi:hypothetical protein